MKKFIIKVLICINLFLILGIVSKSSIKYKEVINSKLYKENLSFVKFEKIYNKYLGDIFPIELVNNEKISAVFNEKLSYNMSEKYKDGVKLDVVENYLVPSQDNGIIVYIGKKDDYGNVIILENDDNINVWYGNICNYNVKLYDRVNKGDIIGEVCNNELYLVYKRNGQVLDYNNFFN